MYRPTKHIDQISEKYGVPIWWAEGDSRVINISTRNRVVFHRIVTEMAWDYSLHDAVMVMAGDAKAA